MKIYNKLVLDSDGKVEFEDSYDYSGPIVECKGGSSPAGTSAYPTGITNAFQDYLGEDGAGALSDTVDSSIIDLFNASLSSLGSDIMVNGNFASSSGWSLDSGWTIGSGVAALAGIVDIVNMSRTDLVLTANTSYEVTFTITNVVGSVECIVSLGDGPAGITRTANGTYVENIVSGNTPSKINFNGTATGGSDGYDLDNVFVKEVIGNPYTAQSAFNPNASQSETTNSPLSDMQLRHDTLDTFVAALDEEVDWESMIDKVIAGSGLATLFPSYGIDARVVTISAADLTDTSNAAADSTSDGLAAAALLADAGAAPHADSLANVELLQAQADTAIKADTAAKADDATANSLTNVALALTAITGEAIADATTAFETNAHAKSKTITSNLDTLAKAAAILDADSVIGTINTTVMSKITDMIATSVTAGITAVNATPVQDMVDAFEQRRKGQHFRAVNRFAGPLADVGAINSSAYIFGMAALESDFNREVSQFDAEASYKIYADAISSYGNAFNSAFNAYLELYRTEFTGYLGLYVEGLKEYLSIYGTQLVRELDSADKMFQSEVNSYNSLMGKYNDVAKGLSDSYIQAALSYNEQQSATFRQLVTSHIGAEIQSEFAIRNQRVAYMINSVKDMVTMLGSRVSAESGATQLQAEVSRLKMISLKEQTDRDIELDSLDALWDIKLYQYVANVLGSPAGGSVFIPDLPSAGASALSGAVAGAGVGAVAAGPVGAGIGAVVGAVAGLLE